MNAPNAGSPAPENTTDEPEAETGGSAYSSLHAAIRSGEFRPGDRLREVEIARRLGLSRTPVREALRRLEAEGIVEHEPRQGAVIRRLSHSEVVELYEMRLVLERTAAEMAAKHAAGAELDELDALNEAMLAAATPAAAARENERFHQCLYMAARNRFLLTTARALSNALMLLGPTTLEGSQRLSDAHEQHRTIIAALRESDAAAAGKAAGAHIEASLRHRLRSLNA